MANASLPKSPIDEPRGYTLVELLVVLALLAMLAGLTIPRLHNTLGRNQLRQAAQQLARDLTTSRLLAIDDGCNYVVRHQDVGSRYSIRPQHQVTSPSSSPDDLTPPVTNVRLREGNSTALAQARDASSAANVNQQRNYDESIDEELPAGVVFENAAAALPRGSPAPNGLPDPASRTIASGEIDKKGAVPARLIANSSWTNALVFYPDGRSDSAEVSLRAEDGSAIRLTVRGLTGGVTIGPIERPALLTEKETQPPISSRTTYEHPK